MGRAPSRPGRKHVDAQALRFVSWITLLSLPLFFRGSSSAHAASASPPAHRRQLSRRCHGWVEGWCARGRLSSPCAISSVGHTPLSQGATASLAAPCDNHPAGPRDRPMHLDWSGLKSAPRRAGWAGPVRPQSADPPHLETWVRYSGNEPGGRFLWRSASPSLHVSISARSRSHRRQPLRRKNFPGRTSRPPRGRGASAAPNSPASEVLR